MSQELLEPPNAKTTTPARPAEQPTPVPAPEVERVRSAPSGASRPIWHRVTSGQYLAGAGVVVALALIVTLIFSALGSAGNKGGSTTTAMQVQQIQAPAHQAYNAQPPAAPTGSVVNLNLVAKEALISIAPGVAYHAWTFNGTIPEPVLRVTQGQTVHFTLTNDDTMPHPIDFHAAQTPWNVNYQPVAPGKSFSFNWTADYPGVFMYHCGAPLVMAHLANGMYGAIIVDPASGWAPAQEYTLEQSEFYTSQAPDGSYYLDMNKAMSSTPDYIVFNGYANQYKATPLQAKAGQRIRLFLVNAGPSLFEAFHVIGAIFSDVYVDGNPANHTVGDQTVVVPPGGGTVVELTIPDAGSYPFVTHSFMAASIGATGVLKVTQ